MSGASYQITWLDPYGQVKGYWNGASRLEMAYGEQVVGALDITLPRLTYSPADFQVDQILEVRRSYSYSPFTLEGERAWFVRSWTFAEDSIRIRAYDGNYLIDGRNVLYKATTAQAAKTGKADDIIRAIIRENLGVSATVTARQLANFAVQPDSSLGPTVTKNFSLDKILPLLQSISLLSQSAGVYLTWDTVYLGAGKFEFRVFLNQRGIDRSGTTGSSLTFSEANRNLQKVEYTEDHSTEITYTLSAGLGEDLNRAWGEYTAPAATLSPWNRREMVADGRNTNDTALLNADAQQQTYTNRAKIIISGDVLQTDNYRYGIDYGYGDLVSVSAYGKTAPCRLATVHIMLSENSLETIDLKLRGEI